MILILILSILTIPFDFLRNLHYWFFCFLLKLIFVLMMKWYISFWFWLINLFRFWLKRRAIIFVIFFSSFFHFGFHVLCSCSFWTKWMSLSWMTFGSGGFANFTPSKMFYSLNKHSDIVLSSEGINSVLGKKILGTITVPFINIIFFRSWCLILWPLQRMEL